MTQDSVDSMLFTQEVLDAWKGHSGSFARRHAIPQARKHKYDIMRWLGYWPFSMIWTLVSDFVKRVARAIYNMIHGILQSISNKIFADVKQDF